MTPVALVTGASRGVGAATAHLLAEANYDVAVNFRDKATRAKQVAAGITRSGRRALAVKADLVDVAAVDAMMGTTVANLGGLDLLVLNASGGLEANMPSDYAMSLNRDAQVRAADAAVAVMNGHGRIVFVTSHAAHFYPREDMPPEYEPVARSKRAGESALLRRAAHYASAGVDFAVVSGDLIEGTITAKLLERAHPGLTGRRRAAARVLPTVQSFAAAIVEVATSQICTPLTFVGSLP